MSTALDPSSQSRTDGSQRTSANGTGAGQSAEPDDAGALRLDDRISHRVHLLTVSVVLVVLTLVQQPGRIGPDTKADLSIDPLGFLLRAWHLWEPLGDFGQLQNQAYGYFLPMGPFYALGHLLGFPAWMVQRAWWAAVLLVAFHGMYRLCIAFGVGAHSLQIIAALSYALSPRMITELGPVSIEAWPMALAPWVLLPLIKVRRGGEPIAAGRSAVAIALCGGVNAVAVGAVLPLPLWWLITRERGPIRRRLSQWWSAAVILGTFWWLAPLLLLGRYSPPFLDWVESASVSTSKASLPGAFRGTTQWVAWFKLPQAIWLAGWSVLSSPAGILLGWLLITISLLGMLRRDLPHRRFVIGASIGGLLLITIGHTGPLTGPWAHVLQTFLDGAGAPLRNTHKFDLIFRIPMTLALAHAMTRVRLPAIRFPGLPVLPGGPRALRFVVSCALIGSAAPALVGQLPAAGSFVKVPDYWAQAAAWLRAHDDGARTLIVPGSSFATSTWGDPHDEPFQALAETKWATRSGVPLSSAGNIRLLNAIEAQLETGRGSSGLAEVFARAGISRILLRADLVRSFQAGSPPLPIVVRSALESSPGLRPEVTFGPELHGTKNVLRVADDGLDVALPAIEIWDVQNKARLADVYPASSALRVRGGPESLLTLADSGRLGGRATVLTGDPEAAALLASPLADTDTMQRREATFSQVRDNYSAPMTADQPYLNARKVHDWLPFRAPEVVARYQGISGVSASTQAGTTTGPWYAFDGNDATAWTSTAFARNQWIQVTFPGEVTLPTSITLVSSGGADLAQVEVRTDRGTERTALSRPQAPNQTQKVLVPAGPARSMRLTVTKVWPGTELEATSINSITIPGISPARPLVMPPSGGTTAPDLIALRTTRDGTDGCAFHNADAICSPRLQTQSEDSDLDRIFQLTADGQYTARGTARVPANGAADALLVPKGPAMSVKASSRRSYEPAERPQAAADRDPGTSWVANPSDPAPALEVSWPHVRTVTRLRWQVASSLAASRPAVLEITGAGRTVVVQPDRDGWVSLPAMRTKHLRVAVTGVAGLESIDRATGFGTILPVGLTELVIPGADDLRHAIPGTSPVRIPCGQGPPISVDGTTVATRVTGTADDVLRRLPMQMLPCATVPVLRAGSARVTVRATPLLTPQALTMDAGTLGTLPRGSTAPVSIDQRNAEHRTITVSSSTEDRVLAVHENLNAGWRATLGGKTLPAVRIDGWQQGWIVPAGRGGAVDLRFTPGSAYRLALLTGFLFLAVLIWFALPPRRRRSSLARRSRHVSALVLPEPASGGTAYGALGAAATVAIGGWWGLGALALVGLAVRQRLRMRNLIAAACAVAGAGAALSNNADEAGAFATISIAAALIVVACMAVRLDAAAGGLLGRISPRLPARQPRRPSGPASPMDRSEG